MPTTQILNRQARQVDLRLQTLNTSTLCEVRAKLLALKRELKSDYSRVKQEINNVSIDIHEADNMRYAVSTELSSRGIGESGEELETTTTSAAANCAHTFRVDGGVGGGAGDAAFQSPVASILDDPHSRRKSCSGNMANVPTPTFVFGPTFSSPFSPPRGGGHHPNNNHPLPTSTPFDPLSTAPATSSSLSCEEQDVIASSASTTRFNNSNFIESGVFCGGNVAGASSTATTTNYTPESNRTLRTVLSRILSSVTQQSPSDSFRHGGGGGGGDLNLQNSFHQYLSSGGAQFTSSENMSRGDGSSVSLLTLNTTSVSDRSNGATSSPSGRPRAGDPTSALVKVLASSGDH